MPSDFHPPVEEYLQTIQYLSEEGTPVIQARLADRLGKSAPAVSEMLDRLASEGYVNRTSKRISLTAKGREAAESVIRKHRLAERLLVDVIGLPWHKVHAEAGRWEHVISDDVESKLVALLGDPATCPHGNPIPGNKSRTLSNVQQVCLFDVADPATVKLERVSEEVESDDGTMRYLDDNGFVPGAVADVKTKAPDGTVVLQVGSQVLALGPDICHRLFVSVPR